MKKIIGIFIISSVLFFVMNSDLPYNIASIKDSHAAWFFFKKDEPEENNFVRIQLPVKVLNRLGSLNSDSSTRQIESDIIDANPGIAVTIVSLGNFIQIVFNYEDNSSDKHKLVAKKLSLYRLALSKPEDNYGQIIDDIAASNKHIDFLEFDRQDDNVFFQWPIIEKSAEEVKEDETMATVVAVPVPMPPVPPKTKGGGTAEALELYDRENEKTLILQDRIAGINEEFKTKEKEYLREINSLKETKMEQLGSIEYLKDSYNKLSKEKEELDNKYAEASGELEKNKQDEKGERSTTYELERRFEKKIGKLERAKRDITLSLETSDFKVKELRQERGALAKRVTKLEELIKESSYENERALKKELAKYDKQLKELKKSRDRLEAQFAEYITKTYESEGTDGSEYLEYLNAELLKLKGNKESLERELKVLTEELQNYKENPASKDSVDVVVSLKAELKKRASELKSLHAQYNTYKEESEKQAADIKSMLEKEKELLEKEFDEYKEAAKNKLQKEYEQLNEKVDIAAEMKQEAAQQIKIINLANEEEKKKLKAELNAALLDNGKAWAELQKKEMKLAEFLKKETSLEVLRTKLIEATDAIFYAELEASISIEQNKKFEDMITEYLVKSMGTSKNATASNTESNNSRMLLSIMRGDNDKVKELLDEGDYYDLDRCLKFAVLRGNFNIVELLIDNYAEVNNEIFNDAAGGRSLEIVELLYKFRAIDINAVNKYCVTAIMRAAFTGNPKVVKFLIDNGAETDGAFIVSVKIGHLEMVRLLLDNDADVNTMTDSGNTALILAANSGNIKLTELLLDYYADVSVKNDKGKTPLMLAKEKDHTYIIKILKEAGAK